MQLFGRTPGYYLFWTGAVYLIGGLLLIGSDWREYSGYVAPVWILVLMLPFVIPPMGRYFNLDVDWDRKMFNWFRNYGKSEGSVAEDMNNVVKFPELKAAPEPKPEPEPPAKIYYRLGLTDNNRVAFSMGYSEITMNATGCQQMIDQLEFFKSQLIEEEEQ